MTQPERKYSYTGIIRDLLLNRIIEPDNAYFYFKHNLAVVFDQLFQFGQENLSEVCLREGYNIEPARFYFCDDAEVNALASRTNGHSTIEINRGTVEQLWDVFCHRSILQDPELADYKALNDFYEQPPHNISIGYIMLQSALLFTFYHELGHLVQFANQTSAAASLDERNMAAGTRPFEFWYHIVEYDADQHGAQQSAAHVIDFWSKLPEEERTNENLSRLIVVTLVGILGFYMMLLDDPETELYFYERTHPHPLIRLQWIYASLLDRISSNLSEVNVDNSAVLAETLRILDVYFRHRNMGNIRARFHEPLFQNYQWIMSYIAHVLATASGPQYDHLITNTIHRRPRVES
ncbi:hypothetical protein [Spirosoma sp. 209]|uniref:hypothetical protein n=1 Tax=Spirosoma sp. 209 TaxID=1955701 RepID=UPI00098D6814|nr:hypothetical protein [Spirosoma sp. 209]